MHGGDEKFITVLVRLDGMKIRGRHRLRSEWILKKYGVRRCIV
jgi:hypothetical protein